MFDFELRFQFGLDLFHDAANIDAFHRLHLKRRQHTTGGQRPDMDMVDALDTRNSLEKMLGDLVGAGGGAVGGRGDGRAGAARGQEL